MSIGQEERENSHSNEETRKWDGGDKGGSEGEPCNNGRVWALSYCCCGRSGQRSDGEREKKREGRNEWEAQRGKQEGGISTTLKNPTHRPRLWMHLWHRSWGILRGLHLTCSSETKNARPANHHTPPPPPPPHHHQPVHSTKHVFVSWAHECELQSTAVFPGQQSRLSGCRNRSPASLRCPTRARLKLILDSPCI